MSGDKALRFNPPPGWPKPPDGWKPPAGWTPDPAWPNPPSGWQLWVPADGSAPGNIVEPVDPSAPLENTPSTTTTDALRARLSLVEAENAALHKRLADLDIDASQVVELNDERILQSVGIYRYHHPLENAVAYKARLKELSAQIAEMVKLGTAIEKSNLFTFDNSLAKGRKMTDDLSKLMLRAYNAEADNSIRTLRVGNVVTAKKRLEASRTAISRLGKMMEMRISGAFHEVRLQEIELTADWLMKKQEEKEAEREERARLREERRVEQELAAERERLEKERAHIANALAALAATGDVNDELEERLSQIDAAIVENDYRKANIRAGYVYVISNYGAFGRGVVKIGLTRRLQPLDRVSELSGASVPFPFDVHTLFFSEDAVSLETELHRHFADRAVNRVNGRKEFFFTTPTEVQTVLAEKVGGLLEYNESVAATEYHQSRAYWPDDAQ